MPHNQLLSLPAQLIDICFDYFCPLDRFASRSEFESDLSISALRQCEEPILHLLSILSLSIRNRDGDYDIIVQRLEDLISLANERFYAFPFSDVPPCWRALFRKASLVKCSAFAAKSVWKREDGALVGGPEMDDETIDDMVRTIDMALIMAGPSDEPDVQTGIDKTFAILQEISANIVDHEKSQNRPTKRQKLDPVAAWSDQFPSRTTFVPPVSHPISRISELSFDDFEKHMHNPKNVDLGSEPLIITGAIDHWPARNERPWSSPSYLLSKTIGGRRLVPIELGRSYVDEGWGQKIVTFKQFMDEYIIFEPGAESSTGYLAQHNLFSQVPALRQDITIPDYCYTSPPSPHKSSPLAGKHAKLAQLDEPLLNAWFGPAGTISPLHTDPYHNILAQAVGRKYVRLYAPRESGKLFPKGIEDGGVDMENTSEVDVGVLEGWDGTADEKKLAESRFDKTSSAEYVDCVLEEGECLYIPLGWWHYVRSVSVSFSVSFWWN